jgi:spore maturation protein CgeB
MRIGIIGVFEPDEFADNIIATLRSMGHETVALGSATPRTWNSPLNRALSLVSRSVVVAEAWQRRIVRTARGNDLDAIVTTQAEVLPSTVKALHRSGIATALWYPDPVSNLDRQMMLAAGYTCVFLKDRLLVERLKRVCHAPVYYLPEACNPMWHRPFPRDKPLQAIAVVGNLYPSRALVLEHLYKARIPLVIHGSGWPRWLTGFEVQRLPVGPDLRREDKARLFRNAAAVLNNLRPAEMDGMNCRLFEAAGSGAAILCERRPVLSELFECGQEVLAFDALDDLIEQARVLLASDGASQTLGDRAAIRAHQDHTYAQRLESLLSILMPT